VLSGKYQNGARPARSRFSLYGEHSPRTQAMTRRFVNEKTLATTARMMAIAEQAGLSPVTLAVAWTLAHDFVGSTIIGATTPEQLADALAAAEVHLSPDVLAACDAVGRDIPYPMG
jgi:aryl-alcohol dehydrogenase-like predicted oxidoreductase